jgi:hypothetical protein
MSDAEKFLFWVRLARGDAFRRQDRPKLVILA